MNRPNLTLKVGMENLAVGIGQGKGEATTVFLEFLIDNLEVNLVMSKGTAISLSADLAKAAQEA